MTIKAIVSKIEKSPYLRNCLTVLPQNSARRRSLPLLSALTVKISKI